MPPEEHEHRQMTREEHFQEMMAHRAKMLPLVKFLKRAGLKFKHARVMNSHIEYFRVDELNALVEAKREQLESNATLAEALKNLPYDVFYFTRPRNQPRLKYPQVLEPAEYGGKFAAFQYDTT